MHKSSLIEILRTFSQKELALFEDFVGSPYYNKNDIVRKLLAELKNHSPDYVSENISREMIWSNLFPGKVYNYGVMKNLIFDLNKLTELFIRLEHSERNIIRKDYELFESLFERDLIGVFARKFSSFEKNYNERKLKELETESEEIYYILSNAYNLKAWSEFSFDSDVDYSEKMAASSLYLFSSFLINWFKDFNNSRSRVIGKKDTGKKGFINITDMFLELLGETGLRKIVDQLLSHSSGELTALKCFYLMFNAEYSGNNSNDYFEFKNALIESSNELSTRDLLDLYAGLGYYLESVKLPEIDINIEFCDFYDSLMKKNIFLEPNGTLREHRFIVFVSHACGVKSSEEMLKFINHYAGKLPEDAKKNSYNFAMAHYHFMRNEFELSLESISKIYESYFDMKHRLKNLSLMNHYELHHYESFLSMLDSYRHFINRHKNIDSLKFESNTLFLEFLNRLFGLRIKMNEHDLQKLIKEITSTYIPQKSWLLKKAEELMAEYSVKCIKKSSS